VLRDERILEGARFSVDTSVVADHGNGVMSARSAASLSEILNVAHRTHEIGLDVLHDEQHSYSG
jgi:hypothetical protein